ncbi:STAS domain-containing protein [Streptomyces sp. AP-93]|uniref:STAS domain-containing protein n=1 Tax=Streptomyces sp. AP-93 TaxID=2929048 RepID=UPI001FAFF8E7|nr:STAS domain-containing protein [Streptomyces sp. AP-93]MCJ0871948.1 STAS domain-containing protein [Streptomyces sp. AP-93]
MECDFGITVRRYGPTVHVALAGELDLDTRSALDDVQAAFDEDVDVLCCDMQHLTFMDVTGLHRLVDLARRAEERGTAVFASNWQRQPLRLLDLTDSLYPSDGHGEPRSKPTSPLSRTLRDAAGTHRAAGAEPVHAALSRRRL